MGHSDQIDRFLGLTDFSFDGRPFGGPAGVLLCLPFVHCHKCNQTRHVPVRILAIPVVVFLAGSAEAQETVALKPGAGRDVVETYCITCHSLDYLPMNAPFLDRQGWETEVNKMVKAFGAPIEPTDTKIIVDYLVTNYGRGN